MNMKNNDERLKAFQTCISTQKQLRSQHRVKDTCSQEAITDKSTGYSGAMQQLVTITHNK